MLSCIFDSTLIVIRLCVRVWKISIISRNYFFLAKNRQMFVRNFDRRNYVDYKWKWYCFNWLSIEDIDNDLLCLLIENPNRKWNMERKKASKSSEKRLFAQEFRTTLPSFQSNIFQEMTTNHISRRKENKIYMFMFSSVLFCFHKTDVRRSEDKYTHTLTQGEREITSSAI